MSYKFDGTGDYAQSGSDFNTVQAMSVAFWAKVPASHGNAQFDRILELGGFATSDGGVGFQVDASTNDVLFVIWDGGSSFSPWTASTMTNDTWHHVVITTDTASNYSAFDGTRSSEYTGVTKSNTATEMTLAARNSGPSNNQTNCLIAELCVWNGYVLTAGDITNLNSGDNPTTISSGNIRAYYPLISDANDYYGNYNLTVTNAVSDVDHPTVDLPAGGATNPKGPLGHPLKGPFGGPV